VRASETPAHSSHVSTGGHNATVRLLLVDKNSARGDVAVGKTGRWEKDFAFGSYAGHHGL